MVDGLVETGFEACLIAFVLMLPLSPTVSPPQTSLCRSACREGPSENPDFLLVRSFHPFHDCLVLCSLDLLFYPLVGFSLFP